MASKTERRRIIDKTLTSLGVVATLALLLIGGLAWWAGSFVTSNVHDQLAAQKIYFPEVDSPALTALPDEQRAAVAQYAGQQVLTGAQAKVFADDFIAVHLSKIAAGQTYSEISAQAQANPSDTQLQAQANTLFKGETLRGLLLGDAYAFGTVGQIAHVVALVALIAGAFMLVLVLLGLLHLARL
ncbi:MAG TPA: hypothetical protein VHB51_01370 [Candidatus Saccharimonadales bacterium]|nr:hypothetical protein [Candidatus Saccharimonadales bacterium]